MIFFSHYRLGAKNPTGDGICDDLTNNVECGFDGMDCCNEGDIFEPVPDTSNCYFCKCHLTVTEPVSTLRDWILMFENE